MNERQDRKDRGATVSLRPSRPLPSRCGFITLDRMIQRNVIAQRPDVALMA
jgi:hypothetical protein